MSQVFTHVVAPGAIVNRTFSFLGNRMHLNKFEAFFLLADFTGSDLMLFCIEGNGVDSCFLQCGSSNSTLVPRCFAVFLGLLYLG